MTAIGSGIDVKPIYATKAAASKHSPAFVVLIVWIIYFIIEAYLRYIFGKSDDGSIKSEGMVEYIMLLFLAVIILYEFYILFIKDVNRHYYGLSLFCLYLISVLLVYIVVESGLTKVLMLLAFLLSLFVIRRFKLKRGELNVLYWVLIIAVFLKIINGSSIWKRDELYKFNSNQCAIALMLVFCVSLVRYFACSKRASSAIIAILAFCLEFIFSSRGATFGCIVFFLLFVILKARKKTCKSSTAFIILTTLVLLGILAAYIYSEVLFDAIGRGKIIIFGKDVFSGRQNIWSLTLRSIKENLWFGVGGYLNNDAALEMNSELYTNAHNQALAILSDLGLIQFILFYILLGMLIATTCVVSRGHNKSMRILLTPVIFFVALTLMNYFEVLYFSRWATPIIIVAYALIGGYSSATYCKRNTVIKHG